jgi:hypothetical protein
VKCQNNVESFNGECYLLDRIWISSETLELLTDSLHLWAVGLIFLGIGHSSDGQHIGKRKIILTVSISNPTNVNKVVGPTVLLSAKGTPSSGKNESSR